MIETEGLTHIHLLVSDLERSLRFYKSAFGLEEQFRDGPTMVFLRTPGSRDTITINADADQTERVGRGGVDHFGFRLKPDVDLDAAIAEVVEAGGRLVERGEHAPCVALRLRCRSRRVPHRTLILPRSRRGWISAPDITVTGKRPALPLTRHESARACAR